MRKFKDGQEVLYKGFLGHIIGYEYGLYRIFFRERPNLTRANLYSFKTPNEKGWTLWTRSSYIQEYQYNDDLDNWV